MTIKKKKNYVNNTQLLESMKTYRTAMDKYSVEGGREPRLSNYVGECIMLISKRLASRPNFSGYSYREEMESDAIENCVIAAKNFDPSRSSNPFAYFTQVAWNAFIRRIAKEKKQSYIKHKNMENQSILDQIENEIAVNVDTKTFEVGREHHYEVIRSFEEKIEIKTKKKTPVGVEKFAEEDREID